MPTIQFAGREIKCAEHENLRRALLSNGAPLYNGIARQIHCRGLGTCGTCAVAIRGSVTPMTAIEKWRLSFPPHRLAMGLRLACQCNVLGDIEIAKHLGLWGHRSEETT
ncbi:MAG: (2Fe-2S)-binding protein [Pirellulaceae bacterium]|nr:(2Fe-2S)-binding protein [Pirellulaceae bacterium]